MATLFSAMERSRARVLLEQMATAGIDLLEGVPEAEARPLREAEETASAEVASLRRQLEVLETRKELSAQERKRQAADSRPSALAAEPVAAVLKRLVAAML